MQNALKHILNNCYNAIVIMIQPVFFPYFVFLPSNALRNPRAHPSPPSTVSVPSHHRVLLTIRTSDLSFLTPAHCISDTSFEMHAEEL